MEGKNYFTHDYRSRLDSKLLEVRMKHGMAGFGVYWALVEMLHEGNGVIQLKPEVIAFELQCSVEIIKDIIGICFTTENDSVTCNRVKENLRIRKEKKDIKSKKGKEAANKRWGNVTLPMDNVKVEDRLPMGDPSITYGLPMGSYAKEKEKEKEKEKAKDKVKDKNNSNTLSLEKLTDTQFEVKGNNSFFEIQNRKITTSEEFDKLFKDL